MKTFRLTKLLCVFPILAVALGAAAAISFPSAVDQYAPYESTTSECLICGRMQTVEHRWMQSPAESIYVGADSLWMCRRRSENVAPGGEWPSDEKRSAQMITCGSFFRLSEVPKSFELAYCGRQGCSPTWISGLRFAVAF